MAKTERAFPEPNDFDDSPKRNRGTIVTDPEMKAMVKIVALMSTLDIDARLRIINWLRAKFILDLRPDLAPQADTWHPIDGIKSAPAQ
jgi:hypothetical protein